MSPIVRSAAALALLGLCLASLVHIASADDGSLAARLARFGFRVKLAEGGYSVEVAAGGLALLLIATIIRGRSKNTNLAVAYTSELLRPDGVLVRNFSSAQKELLKEGPDRFKLFASGRRYCQGMELLFRMARRQDLLAVTVFSAIKDILDIEIAMSEGAMPATALLIASPAAAKVLVPENPDLADLTTRLEPTRDRLAHWPADSLVVHAEHPGLFYDLASPTVMDLAFGPAAFPELQRYFRYIHATSEYAHGDHRQMVRLSFTLPPPGSPATLDRFVSLAAAVVDSLGTYKLTPEQAKRAADARQKVEARRAAAAEERERRLEERRAAKDAETKDRLRKMAPGAREKERARREKILRERRLRSMVKK